MYVMLYGSYTRKPYRQATSGEIERMLSTPRLDHSSCPPGRDGDVFIAPAGEDEGFWPAWHARHPLPPASAGSIAACPPVAGTPKPTWPATSAWTARTSSSRTR
jgi:hypothetical protein